MTKLGTKMKRITGIATAAAAASVVGLTALGAGTTPVLAAPTGYITQAKAKTAAFNHAKVSAGKAYDVDVELEKGKRVTYYDVEFKANGYEYDYEINASNATVIKSSRKALKSNARSNSVTATNKTSTAKTTYIGSKKAKSIALNHAKLKAGNVTDLKIEADKEKGVVFYEVDFKSGNYSYEYDINAVTGKIIKFQKKAVRRAVVSVNTPNTAAVSKIGTEKAKKIALDHARLTVSNVRNFKVKLDREKGVYVYEIEFKSGRYEYEYEINATTGKIIKYDKEYD